MYNHMPEGLGEARGAHTSFFGFLYLKRKTRFLGARFKQDSNGSLPGTYWVIPDGTVSVQSLLSSALRFEAPSVQKNDRFKIKNDRKSGTKIKVTGSRSPTSHGQCWRWSRNRSKILY